MIAPTFKAHCDIFLTLDSRQHLPVQVLWNQEKDTILLLRIFKLYYWIYLKSARLGDLYYLICVFLCSILQRDCV